MDDMVKCPVCGSIKIGKGKLSGYATMQPVDKFFSRGSDVIAEICTECGHIISLKVQDPEKFRIK